MARDPLDEGEWEVGWTWSGFGFRKITLSVEGVDRVGVRIAPERPCCMTEAAQEDTRVYATP